MREEHGPGENTREGGCHRGEQCVNCGEHVRPFLNNGESPTRLPSEEASQG